MQVASAFLQLLCDILTSVAAVGAVARFFFAWLIISPSIILGAFLAYRVNRDARSVGLSAQTRKWWIVGTIAFGLSAYVAYRLTRPSITRVTCANCGRLRRPDHAVCHHCGAQWIVPDLIAPSWRVTGPPDTCDEPVDSMSPSESTITELTTDN